MIRQAVSVNWGRGKPWLRVSSQLHGTRAKVVDLGWCTRCFQTLVLEAHAGQEGHRDWSIAGCSRCSHNPDRGAQSAGPQCHADAVVCACAHGATCHGLVPRTKAPLLDPAQATSAVTIDGSEEQLTDICRARLRASPGCAPREHSSRYVSQEQFVVVVMAPARTRRLRRGSFRSTLW